MKTKNNKISFRSSHQKCSVEKGTLEVHRKILVPEAYNSIKNEALVLTSVSCEFCEIFKNTIFRTLLATASEVFSVWKTGFLLLRYILLKKK